MKKKSKVLFSFLFVLVFMVQLIGSAFAAAPDGAFEAPAEATLSYKLSAVVPGEGGNPETREVKAEDEATTFGEGKSCAVMLGDKALDRAGTNPLTDLLTKNVGITPPEGWYVSALSLRAADSTESSADLLKRATASIYSADLSLESEDLTVRSDAGTFLDMGIFSGDVIGASAFTLDITLSPIDPEATIVVSKDGAPVSSEVTPEAAAPDSDYKQFAGWLLTYENGSSVLVGAEAPIKPYASCSLTPVFTDIIYSGTLTADSLSIAAGEEISFTSVLSGLDESFTVKDVAYELKSGEETVDAASVTEGSYTINIISAKLYKGDAEVPAGNSSLTFAPGTLTVTAAQTPIVKVPLTVTAKAPIYDEAAKTYKLAESETDRYSIEGTLAEGDVAVITVELVEEPAGSFTAKVTSVVINNGETDVSGNYEITMNPSDTVTVPETPAEPIAITVTANKPVLGADGKTYNNDGATITSGTLVDEDKIGELSFEPLELKDGKYVSVLSSVKIVDKDGKAVDENKYKITLASSEPVTPETPEIERGEITVKAKDRSASYDGTEIKANDYEISSGALAEGDKMEVSYEGGSTNVTSSPVESKPVVVIKDSAGKDVTSEYTVKTEAGKVTVTKRDATVTANPVEKAYNGEAFSLGKEGKLSQSGLASGHKAVIKAWYTAQNGKKVSAVEAGQYDVVLSSVVIQDAQGNEVTANYNLTVKNGTLTIKAPTTAIDITLTADSQTWVYDGKAHSVTTYKITSGKLADGDKIESVKVSGTITNAGTAKNEISGAVIKNGGSAVSGGKYNITYVAGTLTVTKAPLTLTAESDSKTYDGKKIDNKNVSATKLANPDHKISVTLGVFDKDGKELQNGAVNPGTYTKKIKSYVIKAGETDVTANYDVKTVDGTLTIKPSDKNNSNSPKTGDTANLGLWIGLLAGSAVLVLAIVAFVVIKNKKKNAGIPTEETDIPRDDDPNDSNDLN